MLLVCFLCDVLCDACDMLYCSSSGMFRDDPTRLVGCFDVSAMYLQLLYVVQCQGICLAPTECNTRGLNLGGVAAV